MATETTDTPPKNEEELGPDIVTSLSSIIDGFSLQERTVRERQIRLWKKLEYLWAGISRVWWDDVAHDWRVFNGEDTANNNDAGYYDKRLNVFRAYLESIIAALSSTVPPVKFYPDDADNELDILTARGSSKIAELISKHNDAPLLWIKALFVYCTQGMIAAYNSTVEDKKFGTVSVPKFEDEETSIDLEFCPTCGSDLTLENFKIIDAEKDEFDPDDDDAKLHSELFAGKTLCPKCMEMVDPEIRQEKFIVPRFTGHTEQAKSRQKIEVLGGLYVEVPNWARCQEEVPILGYSYETHFTNVYKEWPHLRKYGTEEGTVSDAGGTDNYGRWGRLNPQYFGEYPQYTPTVRHKWLRPSAFEAEHDDKIRKELLKKFPDGCHVVFVNDCFVEACNESLDDHWTLTFNPLSEYLHFDPLGMLLTSVQEMTEDLISLTLQTIEHGVPQVFADPTVLSFPQYQNSEINPGSIVPAKAKTGKSLADGFYMISTATLSQEVQPFSEQIQSMGQFVSGALPSIWGGAEAGGTSRTAAQANMSRNQALQRLNNTWKMLNYWWANIFKKVVPAYIKYMQDDERLVKEQYGCFVNDFIRRSELDGKLGNVEAECADQLPNTWGQVKDSVMQLIQLNNPEILQMLGAPENLGIIQKAIGLDDFTIPGEKDREKQLYEINLLLKSGALPNGQPSVMPEFEVDNHQVEAEVTRDWLVSEAGRLNKTQNPEGYQNVLLHLKVHIQMNQMLQMGPQGMPPGPQAPPPPQDGGKPQPKLRPVPAGQ